MAKKGGKKAKNDEPEDVQSGGDSDWEDGGKKPNKKQLDKQAKKQQELDKKKEREALLAMEEDSIEKKPKGKKGKKGGNSDLDDALNAFGSGKNKKTIDAHGVEDSLAALSLLQSDAVGNKDIDRHPERRFKAALAAYSERVMPEFKRENPGLRKQQLEQLIYKEFQKSDENPMNKETNIRFNAKEDEVRKLKESVKDKRSKKFER